MTKYVLKRLVYMVIVFLLVSLLMYSIYNLIPTDPARAQLEPMKTTLKPEEYEQRYQMLRQQMGLDDPLIVRYLRWIGFWPDATRTQRHAAGQLRLLPDLQDGCCQRSAVKNAQHDLHQHFSQRLLHWRSRSRLASTVPCISAANQTTPCRCCPLWATRFQSTSLH